MMVTLLQDKNRKCDFFLWLDPGLPNSHYKETMWKMYVDLESANQVNENLLKVLKLLKVLLGLMVLLLVLFIVLLVKTL